MKQKTLRFIESYFVPWRCSRPSFLSLLIYMKSRKHKTYQLFLIFSPSHPLFSHYLHRRKPIHSPTSQENPISYSFHTKLTTHTKRPEMFRPLNSTPQVPRIIRFWDKFNIPCSKISHVQKNSQLYNCPRSTHTKETNILIENRREAVRTT